MAVLDKAGLQYFWGKVKALLAGKLDASGTAAAATKLATGRTINGVAFDGTANITVADGTRAPIAHASTATTYGLGSATNYGHVKASAAAPLAPGTAAAGMDNGLYAREGHVHPAQTTVSGNAGTATALATARTFTTNLASTTAGSFNGTANVSAGVTGTLPIGSGGTGATTAAAVRVNLEVPSIGDFNNLEEGSQHICVAFEMWYTISQAQIRELDTVKAQLAALAG